MESSIKCLTRKRNFTNDEIEILTTEVAKKSRVLFGKFQLGECSAALKGKAWQDVAAAVSAVGTMKRTTDEVRISERTQILFEFICKISSNQ